MSAASLQAVGRPLRAGWSMVGPQLGHLGGLRTLSTWCVIIQHTGLDLLALQQQVLREWACVRFLKV